MAEKDIEADDPYEFVAVRYPVEPGVDKDAVTARCFVEEYALMGMQRERIMRLFQSPAFSGTNDIYARRGRPFVQEIIDGVYGVAANQEA